ncbi:MAG: 30S ribosomal protein S20 [bacterium]|nr:30S ribosomal protein S20 [bacterium]
MAKKSLSVLKANRQNIKRASRNKSIKSEIKTYIKKTGEAVLDKDKEKANELLGITQKKLDKAAKKRIVHPNKSARYKSKLAKKVSAL